MAHKRPSKKEQRFAQFVFEDQLTDEQIAAEVGITRSTLNRWKAREAIQEQIAQLQVAYQEGLVAEGIARRQNRIDAYNERWRKMAEVIRQRGEEMRNECAGGDTGLLVREIKIANSGDSVEQYAVDTGLLKEMRAHEQQAAQELGQWAEKHEHSGADGGPIQTSAKVVFMVPPKDQPPTPGEPPVDE